MSCTHSRIIGVSGKTSDMCYVSYNRKSHDGYVPNNINIGGGDYIEFDYCADCGQILGVPWPLPQDLTLEEE